MSKPGRPPVHGHTMTRTTMVRMFDEDYRDFTEEAAYFEKLTGARVSVGAYLRMAGREMRGRRLAAEKGRVPFLEIGKKGAR